MNEARQKNQPTSACDKIIATGRRWRVRGLSQVLKAKVPVLILWRDGVRHCLVSLGVSRHTMQHEHRLDHPFSTCCAGASGSKTLAALALLESHGALRSFVSWPGLGRALAPMGSRQALCFGQLALGAAVAKQGIMSWRAMELCAR